MMRPVNRIEVAGPVDAYKTYSVRLPEATHHRSATCAEVECEAWLRGWVTRVPANSKAEAYILADKSRKWHETTGVGSIEREFMFAPGQRCFGSHTVPLEREPLFVIRDGDYRGNPTGRRALVKAQDWIDDFGEHQQRLADQQGRG